MLEQDLVFRFLAGADGVGCHKKHIPQPTSWSLMDLLCTVVFSPGHAIGPGIGSDRNWPSKTRLRDYGTRVDQDTVLNRLSAGVG